MQSLRGRSEIYVVQVCITKDTNFHMQGSYHGGNTASRPISEVKHRWALLVLTWETSLEPNVTLRFFFTTAFDQVTCQVLPTLLYVCGPRRGKCEKTIPLLLCHTCRQRYIFKL